MTAQQRVITARQISPESAGCPYASSPVGPHSRGRIPRLCRRFLVPQGGNPFELKGSLGGCGGVRALPDLQGEGWRGPPRPWPGVPRGGPDGGGVEGEGWRSGELARCALVCLASGGVRCPSGGASDVAKLRALGLASAARKTCPRSLPPRPLITSGTFPRLLRITVIRRKPLRESTP